MDSSLEPETGSLILNLILAIPTSVYPIFFISIILLALSALISGSEVAFFSLSPKQVDNCQNGSSPSEKAIVDLLSKPRQLLATILILNNLVNVALVTLATFATWEIAGRDNESAIVWLTVIVTAAIVFFGEIVPKVFATERNLSFAKFTSKVLFIATTLFKPFSWLLMTMTDVIEKRVKKKGYSVSMNELNQAVEITAKVNQEKEILKGIVSFGTKSVKQIMRSRIDIEAIDSEENFETLLEIINKSTFSRIPIYHDTIDKIIGVLYVKDLLSHIEEGKNYKWQDLIRTEPYFVPESKKIDELLRDFQKKRVHMAIVVDEYGGTSGLITMEDIIEEIVGEINDEFDNDQDVGFRKIDEKTYTFEGKTSLNDFCKIIHADPTEFSEAKGESESIGGLMLELFGKFPTAGEKIEFSKYVFTIVSVDKKRIRSVRVLLKDNVQPEQI
ncbi:gliding motility-associated protein GldE [Flammeovirgaceae bacterium SG7u.111]|nr:gliding motility-associated protein GldE [Flammeovirgaceae bacterium SG7u.132]WPO35443.1 gliding motility-associated protein GldE [Flammeovirgaceae bacterium SG7u.111]